MTPLIQINDEIREATVKENEFLTIQQDFSDELNQADIALAAAKASAQAKLAALGLTVEDLQALGL
jgi:hypothetical protein